MEGEIDSGGGNIQPLTGCLKGSEQPSHLEISSKQVRNMNISTRCWLGQV